MAIIKVDYENNAPVFWDYLRSAEDAPVELREMEARMVDEIEVGTDRAEEIEAWCEGVAGYRDGPVYARTALIFSN